VTDSTGPRPDLAAEIARAVAAVQEWARGVLPEASIGSGTECQWCPICQFVQLLRGDHPEVTEWLAGAGTAMTSALKAFADAATRAPDTAERRGRPQPTPRVERIELGDE
jgi:hypothetical protein